MTILALNESIQMVYNVNLFYNNWDFVSAFRSRKGTNMTPKRRSHKSGNSSTSNGGAATPDEWKLVNYAVSNIVTINHCMRKFDEAELYMN